MKFPRVMPARMYRDPQETIEFDTKLSMAPQPEARKSKRCTYYTMARRAVIRSKTRQAMRGAR